MSPVDEVGGDAHRIGGQFTNCQGPPKRRLVESPGRRSGRDAVGQPSAWLEFEYCPNVARSTDGCEAYLTLRENRGGTEHPETLMYQGLLARDELKALTARIPAFAFLRVSGPNVDDQEPSAGRPIARHAGDVAANEERVPPDAGSNGA